MAGCAGGRQGQDWKPWSAQLELHSSSKGYPAMVTLGQEQPDATEACISAPTRVCQSLPCRGWQPDVGCLRLKLRGQDRTCTDCIAGGRLVGSRARSSRHSHGSSSGGGSSSSSSELPGRRARRGPQCQTLHTNRNEGSAQGWFEPPGNRGMCADGCFRYSACHVLPTHQRLISVKQRR